MSTFYVNGRDDQMYSPLSAEETETAIDGLSKLLNESARLFGSEYSNRSSAEDTVYYAFGIDYRSLEGDSVGMTNEEILAVGKLLKHVAQQLVSQRQERDRAGAS